MGEPSVVMRPLQSMDFKGLKKITESETIVRILRRFSILVEFKGNSRNSTDMRCARSRSLRFTADSAFHEPV